MTKSSRSSEPSKFQKPRPDFPLFPHSTGRWAKKVRGKRHYFGKVEGDENGQAALAKWLDEKDDLLAGRKPRVKTGDELTVEDLCNHFMAFKEDALTSGELAQRTYDRYLETSKYIAKALGKTRVVDDLRPDDFQALRAKMAKKWGPTALGNEIQMIRSIFRYGYDAELMEKPVRFGPGFKKPTAKTIRKTRNASGPKMFTPAQISAILKHATPNMKAMVLLAVNGGLGNTDLGVMSLNAIDLESNWLDYAREKTGIMRRIPLWKETIEAVRESIEARAEPLSSDDDRLLFIGKRGQNYIGNRRGYRVVQEFARVAKNANVEGRAFYDLRRTFQTIGEGANDLAAVQFIMGHAAGNSDMSAVYRQLVSDDRLRAVTSHIHKWLFNSDGTADEVDAKPVRRFRVVG
jgi:integrase